MSDLSSLKSVFEEKGQGHVFAGWGELSPDGREELLADCEKIDFDWIEKRWGEFSEARDAVSRLTGLEPAPVVELPRRSGDAAKNRAAAVGEELLRQGKVAAFLVAGGQGTRLGFDGPKGCFPLGPVSGKTLFQWHAEQIRARSRRYGTPIPWYIMTSRDNDAATRKYFADNGYLGLDPGGVFFFRQGMVPTLDFSGRLLLASPSRLALNPNGHGGSLSGLRASGALDDMRGRGIEMISYFQVDNPLVTICDPVFLGWHVQGRADMSSKVLEKNAPGEKIGIVCVRDGRTHVVEYSDLDAVTMNARAPDGRLKFWAGSIAIHVINVDFVERVGGHGLLPWHQARKKVAHFAGGGIVEPKMENAVKFEMFVFDALPFAERSVTLEVRREHEFAPVKNAVGVDSAESSRALLSACFRGWLSSLGINPSAAIDGGEASAVEISPLYSLDAAELAAKVKPTGLKLERKLLLG